MPGQTSPRVCSDLHRHVACRVAPHIPPRHITVTVSLRCPRDAVKRPD